jgi:hypothetical protein
VAYCSGPLSASRLRWLSADGTDHEVGPGAQPAWLDGQRLVFAAPSFVLGLDGSRVLGDSELFVVDLDTLVTRPLTRTEGVMEMNPAVGADGRIAYSDWGSGALLVGRICGEGRP